MKKMLFGLLTTVILSSSCFANTPTAENDIEFKKELQSKNNDSLKEEETKNEDVKVCTVSCSHTINGITYTAEAGNWFTSCRQASSRCLDKLAYMHL